MLITKSVRSLLTAQQRKVGKDQSYIYIDKWFVGDAEMFVTSFDQPDQ